MTEPKFLNDRGPTTADDPKRTIWLGLCGFWTDDWSLLAKLPLGMPCCPTCGSPGFMSDFQDWDNSVVEMQEHGYPAYQAFVMYSKSKCWDHRDGIERYNAWIKVISGAN